MRRPCIDQLCRRGDTGRALTALAALHEDGKLIGVISHVAALKERIAARVQVEPRSGGVSRISGPGCSGGES